MKCPKCQADNPDTKQFCGDCGTQIFSSKEPRVSHTKTLETSQEELARGAALAERYEIIEELGKGGMGIVYRAKDKKLGREVAIKVLPKEFAQDWERLARFEREAKLLASLNHPNIAAIYGLEESEDLHFLVLELVGGKTLFERVVTASLDIEETLKICHQIAEALEAAHEKGIVHRDLKPANIKVTPDGKVKVLDFGLAKAFETAVSGDVPGIDLSKSPTITAESSRSGTILGTAAYMSPEQARGKAQDKKTDIWSFGCVFYEALSGRQAYEGETISDTIAAILKSEPDWKALPETTPNKIRDLLHRCLQKDPHRRLHDIADARIEIDEALSKPLEPMSTAAKESPPLRRRLRFWHGLLPGLTIGIIAAVLILLNLFRSTPTTQKEIGKYMIALPSDAPLEVHDNTSIALSPEGTSLVYTARRARTSQLFLHDIRQSISKPLPDTERAQAPFFSPDGKWIGYFNYKEGKLMRISPSGGAPFIICDASPNSRGACWGSDDILVFTNSFNSGLYKVPAAGGTPQVVTTLDTEKGEKSHRFPHILPDSKSVLFTIGTSEFTSYDDAQIAIVSLRTGEQKILIEGGGRARYVPTGHIVYARAGSLMAVPFDLKRLHVNGPPVQILENVITADNYGTAQYDFARNGLLIYAVGGPEFYYTKLMWIDREGKTEPLSITSRSFVSLGISPDGKWLSLWVSEGNDNIWLYELERGTEVRLIVEGDQNTPVWTPDSKRVTYNHVQAEMSLLFSKPADFSSPEDMLLKGNSYYYPSSWSPDGKKLIFTEQHPTGGNKDIWVLPMEDKLKPYPFLKTRYNECAGRLSSNGHWIAYTSDESGQYEIYVQPFPHSGEKIQISINGGTLPVWAPDGRELFYLNGDKLMTAAIKMKPEFTVGVPKFLFEAPFMELRTGDSDLYDITPDGKRFITIQRGDHSPPQNLNVVTNWFEELNRLVPSGGK